MRSLQSLLQKIIFSSALAFSSSACLPCYGNDSNCNEGEICVENACVPLREVPSERESTYEDTFSEKLLTDEAGEAVFSSSWGDFFFAVEDAYTGERLPRTELGFLQGDGFSVLTLGKQTYVQGLEVVFPESPSREITAPRSYALIPSEYQQVTIFDYYFSSHREKVLALTDFQRWAEEKYVYLGCFTKEELQQGRTRTVYSLALFSLLAGASETPFFKAVSTLYGEILGAEELGFLDTLPYERYAVYDPLNFTAPPLFEGVEGGMGCDTVEN